ncbi:MAG: 50S ribosomal protein L6 [Gammaproteobacteria bacterium]|jgi:large subunit ribosomal protein L6|nr:50S ribosomal protein L6 [Gammaproteobacteria bacterium]
MSRVARMPIPVPKGVEVSIEPGRVRAKGPKGSLGLDVPPVVSLEREGDVLHIRWVPEPRRNVALAGTMRALLANLVRGVSVGFEKKLELSGVGFRAQVQGRQLQLALGFSHPVVYPIPEGITVETPSQTEIIVRGADRQRVGQVAAELRALRRPDPYKGKGVRYAGEKIVLKETKKK